MRAPESSLYPDNARELTQAMLQFLAQTNDFYQTNRQPVYPAFALPDHDERLAETMAASMAELNQCLQLLGGLMITYSDATDKRHRTCIINEWRGFDEDDGELLWGMAGAPPEAAICLDLDTVINNWSGRL